MGDQDEAEYYRFDTEVLAFVHDVDHVKGKIYKAGSAFGVKPGYVLVEDMTTGESEIVPADASGTRPLNESHPRA